MDRSPFDLAAELASFDLLDLAAGTGGLQLVAANAERQLRFDLFASVIPSIRPVAGGRPPSAGRWRNLLTSPPLGGTAIRRAEDPAENLFTSSLTFDGGPAVVFPGITQSPVEIARLLLRAIFLSPEMPEAYRREMRALLYAVLRLNDEVARRAGLPRNVLPERAQATQVVIPPAADLARLKEAVTFDATSLARVLAPVSPDVLRPLVVEAGCQEPPPDWNWSQAPSYATPILKVGSRHVVLLPSALLVAWRHRALTRAFATAALATLAASFRMAVTREVAHSMSLMGFKQQQPQFPAPPSWADEMVWSFDVDKTAHVLVVTDDLTDFQPGEVLGRWQPAWQAEVQQRLLAFRDVVRQRPVQVQGILQLVVFQGVGRFMSLALTRQIQDPTAHALIISEPDLAVIARKEVGDRLALWKFARALSRLREGAIFGPFTGALDKYAVYAAHRHSFYLSDRARPNWISIGGDVGAGLRFEDARRFDLHGVTQWRGREIVDVQRLYAGSDVPIYLPEPERSMPLELLIEGLPVPLWVLPGPGAPRELEATSFEVREAIAYWLWQVSPSIEGAIGLAARQVPQLGVELTLAASDAWSRPDLEAPAGPWVEATPTDEGAVAVRLTAGALTAFLGADNSGERRLLTALLEALAAMLERITCTAPGWDIAAIVDRHAPLGPKKKLLFLSAVVNLQLRPGSLPPARRVQEADVENLLDEVGPQVTGALGLDLGKIPSAKAVEVLNWIVAALFSRLGAEIAPLSPMNLLELLLAQHESLSYQSANDRLTMPTRLACFGEDRAYLERMASRSQENIKTAQANRFLIELVAARPPHGERALSLDTFDQVMALAEEIVAKGMMSDALKYNVSDVELSILPSGRLGISREGRFTRGMEEFHRYRRRVEVEAAKATFAQHWPVAQHGERPPEVVALDAAVAAEFGFAMAELVDLNWEAIALGEDLGDPAVMELRAATEALAAALGAERDRVTAMIEMLAIRPRDSFLVPGREVESYPWRFNRELSYVRRPYIIRERGGREELLWGARHLSRWWETMLDLITAGRLKATSPAMKEFITSIRAQESEAFNDAVADRFAQRQGLIVRKQVKKLGKQRIADAQGWELGDIDVLVVHPARRRVLAVEAKDLELARTPCELEYEVKKLFRPGISASARHGRRVQWLRDHVPALCESLGIEQGRGAWHVSGMIVLSRALLSPYVFAPPMEVVSIADLDVAAAI